MKLALESRDKEVLEFIHAEQERSRAQLEQLKSSSEALKVDMQKMHEDKLKEVQSELQKQKELTHRVESQLLTMAERMGTNHENHSKALQEWQLVKEDYDRRIQALCSQVDLFERAAPPDPDNLEDDDDNDSDPTDDGDDDSDSTDDGENRDEDTFEDAEANYSRDKYRRFRRHFLDESAWRVKLGTGSAENNREAVFWNILLNRMYHLKIREMKESRYEGKWWESGLRYHTIDGNHWKEIPDGSTWVKYRCRETNEQFTVAEVYRHSRWERRVDVHGTRAYWYNKVTGKTSQLVPTSFEPGQWAWSLQDCEFFNRVDKFRVFLDFLPRS